MPSVPSSEAQCLAVNTKSLRSKPPRKCEGSVELTMNPNPNFDSQCQWGAAADVYLRSGRFEDAENEYWNLLRSIDESQVVDQFIVSKVALGMMLARIGRGDVRGAHAVWTADVEAGDVHALLAVGILGIERAKVSSRDAILYRMLSAHLHSLTEADDRDAAFRTVDRYMGDVVRYWHETEPEMVPLALSNWRGHLHELSNGPIKVGSARLVEWHRAKRETHAQGPIAARPITFPPTSPWKLDWAEGNAGKVIAPDGGEARFEREPGEPSQSKAGFFARLFGRAGR